MCLLFKHPISITVYLKCKSILFIKIKITHSILDKIRINFLIYLSYYYNKILVYIKQISIQNIVFFFADFSIVDLDASFIWNIRRSNKINTCFYILYRICIFYRQFNRNWFLNQLHGIWYTDDMSIRRDYVLKLN